ncbi:peptidase [Streptococcus pneumoniae]|nr:peptidase [Streptococcus pneumoniae]
MGLKAYSSFSMVRALKEGLINLYKEDGTSVTVRA